MKRRRLPDPKRCLPLLVVLLPLLLSVRMASGAAAPPLTEGLPFVQYWSPHDYRGLAQCLCMVQDAKGVMYIGSEAEALEYDGTIWRHLPLPGPGYVCGIAYDAGSDTVYLGMENDVGYLRTEPGGAHTVVSLRDQLPADARDMGSVFSVITTPEGVYFVGAAQLMRWRDGHFQTWKLATNNIPYAAWVAGHLYVCSPRLGLQRLESDRFLSVSDDPLFHRTDIMALFAEANGALLACTFKEGFYAVRGGLAHPLESDCDEFLKKEGVQCAVRLHDGSLAVGTMSAGAVVLDSRRQFRTRVDRAAGLRSNYVRSLCEDQQGGLWLGLETGVARAEIDSPFSVYRAGPDEEMSSAFTSAHWFGTVAFGSANGIHRVAPGDPAAALPPHLESLVTGINAGNALATVVNGLLVIGGSGNGVLLLNTERKLVSILQTPVMYVVASQAHPDYAYFIEEQGRLGRLHLDMATGRWSDDGTVANLRPVGHDPILRESPAGDLWLGTEEHGLYRVQFEESGVGKVTSFYDSPGLLHGEGLVSPCGGKGPLFFATHQRLYRFDERTQTIEPLTTFGPRLADGSLGVDHSMAYDAHSLWTIFKDPRNPTGERFRGRVLAGGLDGTAPRFEALPHKIEEAIGQACIFYPLEQEPSGSAELVGIVGTSGNGIVRLDVGKWEGRLREKPRPFATLIRRAFTTQGEDASHELPILREALSYARNTAHFEFAAATLAFGAAPRFQTRLVGFGQGDWSEWSERPGADYLNLPEGRYTFEVRARNSDGQLGSVGSLGFRVLPPWQRSPWAYALYALAAAAGVYALVRWRSRQLRQRNFALEGLVDARTTELRLARDDAETANRAKSAFLANMSHELRTPLNAVLGYTQLLLKQADLSPRSRERISVIGQSGGHLLSLVNEVLDLSKVEAGKLALSPFDFPFGQLLDEVNAAFRPRLAEKKLTFVEHRASGLPTTVYTDPSRLRQVLFNLLSNAVKFTHQGGVTLSVRSTEERRVRFEVADTGVGIAPNDQRDIFLAFYQAGDSHLASQGTGLGLTISQRLVGLLGGQIQVESRPGAGSRFWFDLPLFNVEPSDGAPSHFSQDSALGRVTGYEGSTRRLLIVDDLAENRRVLRDFLQPLGFEIEEAADGAACLAACAQQMPDAVLLDLRLGVMDGFEVTRSLRTCADGERLGIVAISASVFEHDRQQAIDAGCDAFLPKPFEEAQLLATLGRVMGLLWVQEASPDPVLLLTEVPTVGARTLPGRDVELLRELALQGDATGIRQRLNAWRANGALDGAGELVRRLEILVAAYDMESIHDLLLTVHSYDGS